MATISPPSSRPSTPPPEASLSTLSDLLERYLHLLDQYTTLRAQLSQDLSSVRIAKLVCAPTKLTT